MYHGNSLSAVFLNDSLCQGSHYVQLCYGNSDCKHSEQTQARLASKKLRVSTQITINGIAVTL